MFVKFTFFLHENNVNFLDHSPGNTLIKLKNNKIEFYLVDVNRLKFIKMKKYNRLANFSRISKNKNIIKLIAKEYSNLYKLNYEYTYKTIWKNILNFRLWFNLKKRIKNHFFSKSINKHTS